MRYIKTLGLVAVTAIAAMALAAAASATSITSPEGTTYTSSIVAEAIEGPAFHNATGQNYQCDSQAEGKVESHGSSVTVKGLLKWALTNCSMHTTVKSAGTIEIHTEGGSSNGNGIVTSTGAEVETISGSGVKCIYTTNQTSLGVITGSNNTKGLARVEISSSAIPRTGGSFLCGTFSELTAVYTITTPSTLYVD